MAAEQGRWQEEYGNRHKRFFVRPDLAVDFYAKRERAWLFVTEHLERILGYALSRYVLTVDERENLHVNCVSDVLVALYETPCRSANEFEKEALRQCANCVARAHYEQKKSWRLDARTLGYDALEEQMMKPIWDVALYQQFFDVAYQLQERRFLPNQRACRLLVQIDVEKLGLLDLKLLVLYLLVVLLKVAKTSTLERRALVGAFLLGDDDVVTSEKIFKRTRQSIAVSNVRKARSKGLGKLKKLLQGADE